MKMLHAVKINSIFIYLFIVFLTQSYCMTSKDLEYSAWTTVMIFLEALQIQPPLILTAQKKMTKFAHFHRSEHTVVLIMINIYFSRSLDLLFEWVPDLLLTANGWRVLRRTKMWTDTERERERGEKTPAHLYPDQSILYFNILPAFWQRALIINKLGTRHGEPQRDRERRGRMKERDWGKRWGWKENGEEKKTDKRREGWARRHKPRERKRETWINKTGITNKWRLCGL